jgi:hypothetical protein
MGYQPKVYRRQGGDEQVVADGGKITVESGGTIEIESGGILEIHDGALEAPDMALAQGSVLVGDSDGEAAALSAKGDGKIIVGNGTTVTSVSVSGDATLANTGALTIGAKKVTAAKTAIADGKILIGGADGAAAEQTLSGDATITNAGVVTIAKADDSPFTIGTTTATAETKMTLEFDETTTGVSQILVGSLSVPQVLNENPGAAVVVDTMNILHSAGDGDCDDLIGRYTKVAVAGDGDSGLTVVGTAQRLYVGTADDDSAAQEAYAIQPWAKHSGTGTLLAMSGVSAALILNDGDAFEATNSINAGHFHIKTASGAANGTVTSSNFDGVMVEVYGNVTGLDSMLHLTTNATVDSAIKIGGATNLTNLIELNAIAGCVASAGTASGSWGNADAVATYVLTIDIGGTSYYIPIHSANATGE